MKHTDAQQCNRTTIERRPRQHRFSFDFFHTLMQHLNDSPLIIELYPIEKERDSDDEASPAEQRAHLAALQPMDLDSNAAPIVVRPGILH